MGPEPVDTSGHCGICCLTLSISGAGTQRSGDEPPGVPALPGAEFPQSAGGGATLRLQGWGRGTALPGGVAMRGQEKSKSYRELLTVCLCCCSF